MSPDLRSRLANSGFGPLLLLAALTTPAWASPAPPLEDLLRLAPAAPTLAEGAASVRAAEARVRQADVRRNPSLSLEVENFAGSRPFQGVSGSEITLAASLPLDVAGRRAAAVDVARAEVGVAQALGRQAAAEFARNLTVAYAEAEAADLQLANRQQAADLALQDAVVARELVDAGREAELRSIQALAALAAARSEVEVARAERTEAFLTLTALAAAPAPFTSLSGTVLDRPAAGRTVEASPDDSPAVVAALAQRDAAARRIRVEQIRNRVDPVVSLGVRRLQGDEATALVAGVSTAFPFFDQNRGGTAAAQADLQAAEARLRVARLQAEAGLASALARLSATEVRLQSARQSEGAAAEAARLTRLGFDAGRLPLVEVLNARRQLSEAQARTLEGRLARVRAEADLVRLTGRTPFGVR